MSCELRPYQIKGAEFLAKAKYALLADDMGLGKSVQAIKASELVRSHQVLAIVPAYLRINWEREWERWAKPGTQISIISYEALEKNAALFESADTVIIDEAHMLKTPSAKRTKCVHKYTQKYLPEHLFLLSGTPVLNHVADYWSPLKLLSYCPQGTNGELMDMRFMRSHWAFQLHFSNQKLVRFGSSTFTKFEGHKNVEELRQLLKGKYLRRLKSEVGELPPYIRNFIELKDVWTGDKAITSVDDLISKAQFDHFIQWRAGCSEAKVPYTAKYVRNLLEQSAGPILVVSDFIRPLELLKTELRGFRVETIQGDVSFTSRQAIVDAAQRREVDIILATIKTVRYGITLTSASHVVFHDFSYVPSDNRQVEDRIHRIGQTQTCHSHYMLFGKVDGLVMQALKPKIETIREIVQRTE